MTRWIELSPAEESVQGIINLIAKEQMLDSCPRDVRIYVTEKTPRDSNEAAEYATKFLNARNRQLYVETPVQKNATTDDNWRSHWNNRNRFEQSGPRSNACFECN